MIQNQTLLLIKIIIIVIFTHTPLSAMVLSGSGTNVGGGGGNAESLFQCHETEDIDLIHLENIKALGLSALQILISEFGDLFPISNQNNSQTQTVNLTFLYDQLLKTQVHKTNESIAVDQASIEIRNNDIDPRKARMAISYPNSHSLILSLANLPLTELNWNNLCLSAKIRIIFHECFQLSRLLEDNELSQTSPSAQMRDRFITLIGSANSDLKKRFLELYNVHANTLHYSFIEEHLNKIQEKLSSPQSESQLHAIENTFVRMNEFVAGNNINFNQTATHCPLIEGFYEMPKRNGDKERLLIIQEGCFRIWIYRFVLKKYLGLRPVLSDEFMGHPMVIVKKGSEPVLNSTSLIVDNTPKRLMLNFRNQSIETNVLECSWEGQGLHCKATYTYGLQSKAHENTWLNLVGDQGIDFHYQIIGSTGNKLYEYINQFTKISDQNMEQTSHDDFSSDGEVCISQDSYNSTAQKIFFQFKAFVGMNSAFGFFNPGNPSPEKATQEALIDCESSRFQTCKPINVVSSFQIPIFFYKNTAFSIYLGYTQVDGHKCSTSISETDVVRFIHSRIQNTNNALAYNFNKYSGVNLDSQVLPSQQDVEMDLKKYIWYSRNSSNQRTKFNQNNDQKPIKARLNPRIKTGS